MVSTRSFQRLAKYSREAESFGPQNTQYKQLQSYLEHEKAVDPSTTTVFDIHDGQFVCCFIAWGASQSIINNIKPVVSADGCHLSPEGTGIVCSLSPFPL